MGRELEDGAEIGWGAAFERERLDVQAAEVLATGTRVGVLERLGNERAHEKLRLCGAANPDETRR